MPSTLSRALELADQIEEFQLGHCSPSDDPDKQTAYLYAFRDIAKRFLATAKRIGDPDLSELITGMNSSPEFIEEAYDLKANLLGVIDYLREVAGNPDYERGVTVNSAFLDQGIISQLKSVKSSAFDLAKLIRFCEELNDSYRRANYLACALLIRAVMNHVPPIFGVQTFGQVVSGSGRSVKAILGRLEDEARPIADLHTHMLIRSREPLTSKHQVEPYKASFEILIQEILARTAPAQ
ncbi:MAG: hypothetical protein LAO24_24390 [Acidobacteriia bacterium]|nr:hypothetical protein [Terriglobia bacterium]